ncbi:hypothetical protein [Pedobacter sp.]|jgi:hypothetical protein|uniref:hypothetical protein n=1 Tax=Pedobacter sp. TaxID=1411316 RepID=UPI002D0CEE96|nr:hypothetical protein [Pedobacter sp.]HWW39654.1 hypothetical protein [Pedobacter sp.]
MAGFWESDLGEVTGSSQDAFAKSFVLVPDGTMALARIDKFINDEYNGNKFLKIEWTLTDGDFRGAKVEQKIKVWGDSRDKDPVKTRHRALNMLKLLFNLYNLKPRHSNDPTDQDLALFIDKVAGIKIRETEPNADGKQYNWVAEVHPQTGFKCETGIKIVVTHNHLNEANDLFDSAFSRNKHVNNESDIPF